MGGGTGLSSCCHSSHQLWCPRLLQSAAPSSAGVPAGAMLQSQGPLHGLGCDCLDISPSLQLAATGGADKLVKLHTLLVGTAASRE